jgi:FkbM family methyltransferase
VHTVSHALWPSGRRSPQRVRAGLAAGLVLELDPRYESKLLRGDVEPEVQRRLAELVRPGWTVWDVGASLGYFSLALARLVAPEGTVVAFEPDATMTELLERHARANGIANVVVAPVAAWSTSGEVPFGIDPADRGRKHGRVGDVAAPVEALSLDDALGRYPPPQLVKIDVEGAELDVLRGAESLVRRYAPVVVCEVHLERGAAAERLPAVVSLLEAAGYRVEELDRGSDPRHVLALPTSA